MIQQTDPGAVHMAQQIRGLTYYFTFAGRKTHETRDGSAVHIHFSGLIETRNCPSGSQHLSFLRLLALLEQNL